MERDVRKIGEILIAKGYITNVDLERALEEQKRTKEFLGTILVKTGVIKEKVLLKVLSAQFNMPVVDLKNRYIDYEIVKELNIPLLLIQKCFPLRRDGQTVTIAISNPLDALLLREMEDKSKGLQLKIVLSSSDDIKDAIKRYQRYLYGDIIKMLDKPIEDNNNG